MSSALVLYRGAVLAQWVDDNRHMNDGYYPVAFGIATWAVQDHLGLDPDYRARTGCTLYTVEAHLTYARELTEGQALHVESVVAGVDAKRIHAFHRMVATDEGYLAATMELMMVHVDQALGKVVSMPDALVAPIRDLASAHADLGMPEELGRSVRALRRPP